MRWWLDWQWSDYPAKHRSRVNLLIHLAAVPAFQLGSLLIVWGVLGFALAVAEQWITFPRFVLSGGWYRNLTRSS